jgi:hypothetical protein
LVATPLTQRQDWFGISNKGRGGPDGETQPAHVDKLLLNSAKEPLVSIIR